MPGINDLRNNQSDLSSNGNISPNNNFSRSIVGVNDFKLTALQSPFGKSITAFEPIPGCPQGLEGLFTEKNFFFQEVQRDHIEYDLKDEVRPTYNIIVDGGNRIYVMVNQAPRFASKRFFHYDLVGPNGMTCMTFEGDIGTAPAFPCCINQKTENGIRAVQFHQPIGYIRPQYKSPQCYSYLNLSSEGVQYALKCNADSKIFKARTRRPTQSRRFDSGLEVIADENTLVARISNCRKATFDFTNGPVNFALSLSKDYETLEPVAKAMLLATAVLHENYYMRTTARSRMDNVGFKDI